MSPVDVIVGTVTVPVNVGLANGAAPDTSDTLIVPSASGLPSDIKSASVRALVIYLNPLCSDMSSISILNRLCVYGCTDGLNLCAFACDVCIGCNDMA